MYSTEGWDDVGVSNKRNNIMIKIISNSTDALARIIWRILVWITGIKMPVESARAFLTVTTKAKNTAQTESNNEGSRHLCSA